jgi:hypothetical protein
VHQQLQGSATASISSVAEASAVPLARQRMGVSSRAASSIASLGGSQSFPSYAPSEDQQQGWRQQQQGLAGPDQQPAVAGQGLPMLRQLVEEEEAQLDLAGVAPMDMLQREVGMGRCSAAGATSALPTALFTTTTSNKHGSNYSKTHHQQCSMDKRGSCTCCTTSYL